SRATFSTTTCRRSKPACRSSACSDRGAGRWLFGSAVGACTKPPGGCAPPQKTGLPAARTSRRTGAPTLRTADRAAREKPEFVRPVPRRKNIFDSRRRFRCAGCDPGFARRLPRRGNGLRKRTFRGENRVRNIYRIVNYIVVYVDRPKFTLLSPPPEWGGAL